MRLAVAGKGGSGKTTLSATFARLAARAGAHVVAIDADSNPNLAVALGVPPAAAVDHHALPPDLISRRFDGPALLHPVEEVIGDHALPAPDDVMVVAMGTPKHADEGCLCSAHATVSGLLGDLGARPETVVVVDLEATPEHLSRGTARHVDALVIVAEPYFRSLEAARRVAALAAELPIPRRVVVANKIRTDEDRDAIRAFCDRHDLDLMAEVPWSDSVVDADRRGVPLLDADPNGDVVGAIGSFQRDLLSASPG